jgi:hypothetical protein
MKLLTFVSAAIFLAFQPSSASAQWNAATDFNAATFTNPNSVWSYGYDPAAIAGYQLKLFNLFTTTGAFPIAWQDSTYVSLSTPTFAKNTSSSILFGAQPGQIALHPGPAANGDAAILRFTAPQSGQYSIIAQFLAGDAGETDALIVLNNNIASPLSNLGITSLNPTYSVAALALSAGDTVDFVVGNRGFYNGDTTPLSVLISAVPEPSNTALTVLGLAYLGRRLHWGRTMSDRADR